MKQSKPELRPNPKPAQANVVKSSSGRDAIRLSSIDFVRQNPLDTFWRLAIAEGYDKERVSANELHLSVPGFFCDHHLSLSWSPNDEQIQLFLVFDGRVPGGRTDKICRLMSLINERLSVGHFDYWDKDNALVYRHSMSLSGASKLCMPQAMSMVSSALNAAEKGYPACQYVIWAGMSPDDALNSALVDQAARL